MTVANMKSHLENLNTNFDMCNKNERRCSTIEIKLLLAKANVVINIASNSLVKLHGNIQKQCSKILENLPKADFFSDVKEFTLAMGNAM